MCVLPIEVLVRRGLVRDYTPVPFLRSLSSMSSLEPIPGGLTDIDTPSYQRESSYGRELSREEHSEPPQLKKLWTRIRWLFVLNVAVALGTAFQAYFQYQANLLTRELLAPTKDSADAALIAARAAENQLPLQLGQMDIARESIVEARKAADSANRATREQFRTDQRAWLSYSHELITDLDEANHLVLEMPLTNTGNTPAYRVRAEMYVTVSLLGIEPRDREPWTTFQNVGVLMPNEQGRTVTLDHVFPNTVSGASYRGSKSTLTVTTRLQYCDAFRQPHWVMSCAARKFGDPAWTNCGTDTDALDGTTLDGGFRARRSWTFDTEPAYKC